MDWRLSVFCRQQGRKKTCGTKTEDYGKIVLLFEIFVSFSLVELYIHILLKSVFVVVCKQKKHATMNRSPHNHCMVLPCSFPRHA